MSEPIRVLQVVKSMQQNGGVENMIMSLYRNIDTSKVQFDFIIHVDKKHSFIKEIEALGGKVYRFPQYNGKNHLDYCKKWDKFFENNSSYKIVHGHFYSIAAIYLRIARRHKLITIAHSHNTLAAKGFQAIVKKIFQYQIRYIADYFFACSLDAGKWLFGQKVCQSSNFYILKNSIETDKFVFNANKRNAIRKELKAEGKFIIGHIGRFSHQKNHDFLIDVFKIIYNKRPDAVLVLIGDGNLQSIIKQRVKNLNIEQSVIFAGICSDVSKLLQAMDAFVFPSLYEGLGIVLIEAQASGLQCIVSDKIPKEAFITDLIQEVSLTESKELWVQYIIDIANKDRNIDMKDKIIDAGYDIKNNAKWLEEFYLTIKC